VLQVNYIFVGAKPGTWGEVGANPTLSRMPFLLSEAPALQGFQGCQNRANSGECCSERGFRGSEIEQSSKPARTLSSKTHESGQRTLLLCVRHQALEFFEPVQDHVQTSDLYRLPRLLRPCEKKSTTVWMEIVASHRRAIFEMKVEQRLG
jgi:hypothetical protein